MAMVKDANSHEMESRGSWGKKTLITCFWMVTFIITSSCGEMSKIEEDVASHLKNKFKNDVSLIKGQINSTNDGSKNYYEIKFHNTHLELNELMATYSALYLFENIKSNQLDLVKIHSISSKTNIYEYTSDEIKLFIDAKKTLFNIFGCLERTDYSCVYNSMSSDIKSEYTMDEFIKLLDNKLNTEYKNLHFVGIEEANHNNKNLIRVVGFCGNKKNWIFDIHLSYDSDNIIYGLNFEEN